METQVKRGRWWSVRCEEAGAIRERCVCIVVVCIIEHTTCNWVHSAWCRSKKYLQSRDWHHPHHMHLHRGREDVSPTLDGSRCWQGQPASHGRLSSINRQDPSRQQADIGWWCFQARVAPCVIAPPACDGPIIKNDASVFSRHRHVDNKAPGWCVDEVIRTVIVAVVPSPICPTAPRPNTAQYRWPVRHNSCIFLQKR